MFWIPLSLCLLTLFGFSVSSDSIVLIDGFYYERLRTHNITEIYPRNNYIVTHYLYNYMENEIANLTCITYHRSYHVEWKYLPDFIEKNNTDSSPYYSKPLKLNLTSSLNGLIIICGLFSQQNPHKRLPKAVLHLKMDTGNSVSDIKVWLEGLEDTKLKINITRVKNPIDPDIYDEVTHYEYNYVENEQVNIICRTNSANIREVLEWEGIPESVKKKPIDKKIKLSSSINGYILSCVLRNQYSKFPISKATVQFKMVTAEFPNSCNPGFYITGLKEKLIFKEGPSDKLNTKCEAEYVYRVEESLELTCHKRLQGGFAEKNYLNMMWHFGGLEPKGKDLIENRTKSTLYSLTNVIKITRNDNGTEIVCEVQKKMPNQQIGREMLIIKLLWREPETNGQHEIDSQSIKENIKENERNGDQQKTIFVAMGAIGTVCLVLILVIIWTQLRRRKEDRVPMINSTNDSQGSIKNENQFPPNLESVYAKTLDAKQETVMYTEPYVEKDISELYTTPIPKSQRTKNHGVAVLPQKWTQESPYVEIDVNKTESKQAKTKKNPKYSNLFVDGRYVNARTETEYVEPSYCETKN